MTPQQHRELDKWALKLWYDRYLQGGTEEFSRWFCSLKVQECLEKLK